MSSTNNYTFWYELSIWEWPRPGDKKSSAEYQTLFSNVLMQNTRPTVLCTTVWVQNYLLPHEILGTSLESRLSVLDFVLQLWRKIGSKAACLLAEEVKRLPISSQCRQSQCPPTKLWDKIWIGKPGFKATWYQLTYCGLSKPTHFLAMI